MCTQVDPETPVRKYSCIDIHMHMAGVDTGGLTFGPKPGAIDKG